MVEEGRKELQVDVRAEIDADPCAHRLHRDLDHDERGESDSQHRQEVAVAADNDPIDRKLQEERHRDREDLERERQQQDLRDRALQPRGDAEELPRMDLFALVLLLEIGGRRELHPDAGEVARRLIQRKHAFAARRVVHGDLAAGDLGEDDEVVHVPMQDRWEPQLSERCERHLHAARRHAHGLGDLGDVLERDALQRGRKP